MSGHRIVAVAGRGVVPAGEPVLLADDRGALHGDGIFETMHVRGGRPWLVGEHLARLAGAAAVVDLTLPDPAELVELIGVTCADWPTGVEGALRLVCTRGPESSRQPTVWTTLTEVPAGARAARRAGLAVATLPLPVTATGRAGLDWLPAGIKSTSYALSNAARRWAATNGVDDVLWVSTDGYALEGPTANLVWLDGTTLCTVPAQATGILPGVTAGWLLAHAGRLGLTAAERMVTPEQLRASAGVWFTSSVRGLAPVRSLDGRALPDSRYTAELLDLLGFPTP
ncbi:aminotransferase class IV, partial [Micromonospora echinofusca]